MYNLTKSGVLYSIFILFISINSYSQVTPPNADSDAECGADCYDIFNWTPVADPAGNVLGGEGFAEDSGCSTTIEGFVEYTGVNNPDLSGSSVGTTASNGDTDNWQFTFGTALTNPVINLGALQTDSEVTIKDCNGAIIAATCINSCATSLTGPPWTGDSGYSLQLNGTFSCFEVCVSVFRNDFYTISIGTCLAIYLHLHVQSVLQVILNLLTWIKQEVFLIPRILICHFLLVLWKLMVFVLGNMNLYTVISPII